MKTSTTIADPKVPGTVGVEAPLRIAEPDVKALMEGAMLSLRLEQLLQLSRPSLVRLPPPPLPLRRRR
jgi:hypothetical protein